MRKFNYRKTLIGLLPDGVGEITKPNKKQAAKAKARRKMQRESRRRNRQR